MITSSEWFLQYWHYILDPKVLQSLTKIHLTKRFSSNLLPTCYIICLKDGCWRDEHKKPDRPFCPKPKQLSSCKELSSVLAWGGINWNLGCQYHTNSKHIVWLGRILSSDRPIWGELPCQKKTHQRGSEYIIFFCLLLGPWGTDGLLWPNVA